jgi:enolase
MVEHAHRLVQRQYPAICSIEDGCCGRRHGKAGSCSRDNARQQTTQLVGDDLFVTNTTSVCSDGINAGIARTAF